MGPAVVVVDKNVLEETPGTGSDFITWVDERTGNLEVYIQRHGDPLPQFIAQTESQERYQSASAEWVAFSREVIRGPIPEDPRVVKTWDLVVYSVDEVREVYTSGTTGANETVTLASANWVAYSTDAHTNATGTRLNTIEVMALSGPNALQPRLAHDSGRNQYLASLSDTHLVLVEQLDQGDQIVAVRLDSMQATVVVPRVEGIGLDAPVLSGDRLMWLEYVREGAISRLRMRDVNTGADLGSWDAPGDRSFRRMSNVGDLIVAEVVEPDERHLLYAWCMSDGAPTPIPGHNAYSQYPVLSDWGTVVYLSLAGTALYIYERPIACGELPGAGGPPKGGVPGPGVWAVLAAATVLVLVLVRRIRPREVE